jgi:hypothetical protein
MIFVLLVLLWRTCEGFKYSGVLFEREAEFRNRERRRSGCGKIGWRLG